MAERYIDPIALVDSIHEGASEAYRALIPLASLTGSINDISPILDYQSTKNEFISGLVTRIAFTEVMNKIAVNPLSTLKKGSIPLGKNIQEIFTNPAKVNRFDPEGKSLLQRTIPDTKVLYHTRNREDIYEVTISEEQLKSAFVSWEKLTELTASIINSLYSGDNFDEFRLMKNTFATAINNGSVLTTDVPAVINEATGKVLVKAIKNASKLFTFPGSRFNKYQEMAQVAGTPDPNPAIVWTPQPDQILLVRSDCAVEIDVDVLAQAFNLDKVEFMPKMMEYDILDNSPNCLAILCDKSFPKIYDNELKMTEFYNPKGLYWNYYLHHWQTYSVSYFCNAIAFIALQSAVAELAKITDLSVTTVPALTENTKTAIEEAILVLANAELGAGYTATLLSGSTYDTVTNIWKGKFKVTKDADIHDIALDEYTRTIAITIAE